MPGEHSCLLLLIRLGRREVASTLDFNASIPGFRMSHGSRIDPGSNLIKATTLASRIRAACLVRKSR